MDKNKLKSIISKKANGNSNLSAQLYQMFFFEKILERISKSNYKHNIILKGGLLLSSIVGNDERTTKDMDAILKSIPLEKDNIHEIINEILNIDLEDNIKFTIIDIKDIRLEDEYGGFKINVLAEMDTLKVYLAIELSTGDKITPREIEYKYKCIFENKNVPILAYTIETIIAEKYHCITTRGEFNTRMKDFYDIYILIKENKEKVDFNNLVLAIKNTFNRRETDLNIEEIKELLNEMKVSEKLSNLWKNYQKTAIYSDKIEYSNLFEPLEIITNILDKELLNV